MSTKNKKTNKKTTIKSTNEKIVVEETKDIKINSKDIAREKAKKKSLINGIIAVTIILIASISMLVPLLQNTKFGLDLQGGFEILYKINSTDGSKVTTDMINSTYKIILKRVDILGVSEPEISIEGNNVRIQLAGVNDEKEAKSVLSQMANLTFRNSKDELIMTSSVLKGNGVKVAQDQNNLSSYYLTLEIADVNTFHKKTEEIRKAGDVLVIWLDFEEGVDSFEKDKASCGVDSNSRCISYASIAGELTGATVTLSGNFTLSEAQTLADLINSGSLPTKLTELSSRTVNASFGENALRSTAIAGLVGISAVIILLVVLYGFSGVISVVGIAIYTALVFLIFGMVGGRLTLPGIAGLVIGIGMAVDAVVISFARIKDELRNKSSLSEAFVKGNTNSLSSIMDGNITTLIVAIIMFVFGESSVKGFATMLIISIIVTVFVMVYVMRKLLGMFVKSSFFDNKMKFFLGIRNLEKRTFFERMDYVRRSKLIIISTLLVLVAGISYIGFNGFNLGIDFKGGTSISLNSSDKITAVSVEEKLVELGYSVEKSENINENTVYIILSDVFSAEDNKKIENTFSTEYKDANTNIGAVSNTVKKKLVENAAIALIFACIGLIIYVALRFTFNFALCAILALVHDALVMCIIFSVFHLEITTIFIAALLSIIGFSINDTIVTFDRIRENRKKIYKDKIKNKEELKELVNRSMRETVNRSIITTLTALFTVVALILFGAHDIFNFNFALLVGMVAGVYSSVFIAPQLWMLLEYKNIGKPDKKKWYEVEEKDDIEELKVKGINC